MVKKKASKKIKCTATGSSSNAKPFKNKANSSTSPDVKSAVAGVHAPAWTLYVAIIAASVLLIIVASATYKYFLNSESIQQVVDTSTNSTQTTVTDLSGDRIVCIADYKPVCGNDDKTYTNSCFAALANMTVASQGECTKTSTKSSNYKPAEPASSSGDSGATNSDCFDPDELNVMSATEVVKDDVTYPDHCEGIMVREYFCADDVPQSKVLSCPEDHHCENGACEPMPDPDNSECVDSDGGMNAAVKGVVSKSGNDYDDVCIDSAIVQEYQCENNEVRSEEIICTLGDMCVDGACMLSSSQPVSQTCVDSDGGEVYDTQGTTTIVFNAGGSTIYSDYCDANDNNNLVEYYCDGSFQKSTTIACHPGKYCNDGACGVEPQCIDPDSNDLTQQTTVTKGTESQLDYCQWDNPRTIHEAVCNNNKIELNMQTCPSGKWCQAGACITEPTCTETDSGKDYSVSGTTIKGTNSNSDYCMGASLKEFYCDSTGLFKEELYTCPSGCQGGKCN